MATIIKVMVNGQETSAIELDFDIKREEWNEYRIPDGGTVRVKTTVSRILMQVNEDGKPILNNNGTPVIMIHSRNDGVLRQ